MLITEYSTLFNAQDNGQIEFIKTAHVIACASYTENFKAGDKIPKGYKLQLGHTRLLVRFVYYHLEFYIYFFGQTKMLIGITTKNQFNIVYSQFGLYFKENLEDIIKSVNNDRKELLKTR